MDWNKISYSKYQCQIFTIKYQVENLVFIRTIAIKIHEEIQSMILIYCLWERKRLFF